MAFRVGFCAIDVGDWIQRLRTRDVYYVPAGVLRTVGASSHC